MNRTTRIAMTIAAALFVAGIAAGASLDRAGVWTGQPPARPDGPTAPSRALINDGGFEQGPPPASAWTEVVVGSCEWIGDNSGAWYVSAYEGTNDVWLGGYCDDGAGGYGPATTTVTQDVSVPAGATTLAFHYIALRLDADDEPADGDRAYVAVDGAEVWTLPFVSADNTYPDWTGPVEIDLGAWAGQTVSLTFGGVGVGDATGNIRFDAIEFVAGSTPAELASWGALKSMYR
jgi:hypothetical protein